MTPDNYTTDEDVARVRALEDKKDVSRQDCWARYQIVLLQDIRFLLSELVSYEQGKFHSR